MTVTDRKPAKTANAGKTTSSATPSGRASLSMMPEVNAASVMQVLNTTGEPDLVTLIGELRKHGTCVNKGDSTGIERMLLSQAHALDSMFASLARRAKAQETLAPFEAHMKFALRAQSQCRATLETLATIKNPPTVFAKQANIAHGHQQVNNGEGVPVARGKNENEQSELLGNDHGERLDTATTHAASKGNPPLETVESIYRPTHAARKGRIEP
jgi:hypothetical protein